VPDSMEALTMTAMEVASRASGPGREALIKVLPHVTEKWRGRVLGSTIHDLCTLLPEVDGFDALVILRALDRFGPGNAAEFVSWAINGGEHGQVRE
jgi:hypothetical protein